MTLKVLAIALASVSFSASSWGQSPDDLRGTWTLDSSVIERDGAKIDQFGSGARGMMTLAPDGQFMLTIIGPDLPRFSSNNRASGTAEENKAVISKSIAMIGVYSLDLAAKALTFKVEASTFPNWNGTEQKREIVTATKDELKYVTGAASSGGVAMVTWKRTK